MIQFMTGPSIPRRKYSKAKPISHETSGTMFETRILGGHAGDRGTDSYRAVEEWCRGPGISLQEEQQASSLTRDINQR